MNAFLLMKGARKVVEVCTAVKPGEKVVVVTDNTLLHVADAIAGAAYERGAETVITVMPPPAVDGAEPPRAVVEALKAADVGIMPLSYSISHSEGIREALKSGTRIGALSGFTTDMMVRGGIEADFVKFRPLCDAVAAAFGEAREAVLTTPAGTHVVMDLKGRPGNSHPCIVDKPGKYSAIPNIEANVSPVAGEGTIVFDGSVPNLRMGVVDAPIIVEVRNGRIVEIRGGKQAAVLRTIWEREKDPTVYTVAQLAVGLNPFCTAFTGVFLNDHGAYGTVHIGIGTSAALGGDTQSAMHVDGMMYNPTLKLDGQAIIEDGKVLIGSAAELLATV